MQTNPKRTLKPGINTPIICKGCGRKVGVVRLKPRVKWQTVKWAIGLGLALNITSELLIYFILK